MIKGSDIGLRCVNRKNENSYHSGRDGRIPGGKFEGFRRVCSMCVSDEPLLPHEDNGLEEGKARGRTTPQQKAAESEEGQKSEGKRWGRLKNHSD